jgi:quercetin dioxygenase-like cupin family protein
MMRELDDLRVVEPGDGTWIEGSGSRRRELIALAETGGRWALGEVTAGPGEDVGTHIHPGEPEAIIVLEGELELHGAEGVTHLSAGDVVFVPPDTEHGLRTPRGGRWLAVWPDIDARVPGPRYAAE